MNEADRLSYVSAMGDRDLEKKPYDEQERRVCDYILSLTNNQVGCGDDPIGFLIASHGYIRYELERAMKERDQYKKMLDLRE